MEDKAAMNCIEYRRRMLASPRAAEPELAGHAAGCPQCAAFAAELERLESELEGAVRVPVPEGLADRVLLNHKLRARRSFGALALAATLLLSVGVGWHQWETERAAVARSMIEHVLSEPEVFAADGDVPAERVTQAVATVGERLQSPLGRVSFLDNCKGLVPDGTHMVVHTPYGRAAVLLLPNMDQRWRARVADRGLAATVLPARRGVIAIVADTADGAARMEAQLLHALKKES